MANSLFGRLRDSLERAVSSAVEKIREIVTGVSTQQETPVTYQTEQDASNAIVEIEENADEVRGKLFAEEQEYYDTPIELRKWYDLTDDTQLAQLAWYSGLKMLTSEQVGKIVSDKTKVRRTPHATVESAIQYMIDVPAGIRRGIVQRGDYFYCVLDDTTNGAKKSRKKPKQGKRRRR